jgi:hypothetical protein
MRASDGWSYSGNAPGSVRVARPSEQRSCRSGQRGDLLPEIRELFNEVGSLAVFVVGEAEANLVQRRKGAKSGNALRLGDLA